MSEQSTEKSRHRGAASLSALAAMTMAFACVYDGDDRCGENQVYDGVCVCAPGFTFDTASEACIGCGEHASFRNGACACDDGFAQDSILKKCVEAPPGLGVACNDSTPCTVGEFTYCQRENTLADGYCTKTGCVGTPCPAGYGCDQSGDPTFCARPPVGLNAPCDSSDDCATFEATWCDSFKSHTCQVANCTLSPNDCYAGALCCDYSQYASFGIPPSVCVPGDACPEQ